LVPLRKTSLGQDREAPGQQRRLWITVALLLLPALVFYARLAVVEPIQNWQADDLAINYSAATVLRSGGFIYDAAALRAAHEARIGPASKLYSALFLTYNNTPATALLFEPLSLLPFRMAQAVFVIVNNVLYFLGLGLTLYALRAGPLEVFLGVLLSTVLFFYAVRQTFGLGQMNGLVVCLLAVAMTLALQQRDGWSGAVIAGAAVLKVSPIFLLGYFIARQRWRAAWGALAAGGVLFTVMLIGAGGNTLVQFITQVLPALGHGSAAFPNQSLLGALYRWAVPAADMLSAEGAGDYPLVRGVWLLISIGVGVITLWFVARARLVSRPQNAVGFSIFIVAGLMIGGLSWDHYLLWLSIPICALIVDWFHNRWLTPIEFWAVFLIALTLLSVPVPYQAQLYRLIGPPGSALMTWGLLVLWLLMLGRLRATRLVIVQESPLI
jgi:hypothetical protein